MHNATNPSQKVCHLLHFALHRMGHFIPPKIPSSDPLNRIENHHECELCFGGSPGVRANQTLIVKRLHKGSHLLIAAQFPTVDCHFEAYRTIAKYCGSAPSNNPFIRQIQGDRRALKDKDIVCFYGKLHPKYLTHAANEHVEGVVKALVEEALQEETSPQLEELHETLFKDGYRFVSVYVDDDEDETWVYRELSKLASVRVLRNAAGIGGRKKRLCKTPGCEKQAKKGGLCRSCGGGKRCQTPDCPHGAENGYDYCISCGGGKRCQTPDCPHGAASGSDFCSSCGGGGRRCQTPGCPKGARGGYDFCISCGGGRRCQTPDCPHGAASGCDFCMTCFVKKFGCRTRKCPNAAVAGSNFCTPCNEIQRRRIEAAHYQQHGGYHGSYYPPLPLPLPPPSHYHQGPPSHYYSAFPAGFQPVLPTGMTDPPHAAASSSDCSSSDPTSHKRSREDVSDIVEEGTNISEV